MQTWSLCNPKAAPAKGAGGQLRSVDSLKGKRLGLLDNAKPNADHLLLQVGAILKDRYGVAEVLHLRKPTATHGAPAEVLDRLAAEVDVVLTSTGD